MSIIGIPLQSLDDQDDNHNMLPICDDIPDDQPYVTLVFDSPLSFNFITDDSVTRITKSKKAYTYYRRRRNPIGSEFPIRKSPIQKSPIHKSPIHKSPICKSPRLSPWFSPRRSPRLSSQ
jgi:hypothetical protein